MNSTADGVLRLRARSARGLTLIELLVVVVLVALLMGAMIMGLGATTNARIRSAATLVASGVRVAFSRAQSTSKSMRLVFDLDRETLLLEESDKPMLVRRDDVVTGGAEGSTPQEIEAIKDAERIVDGPRVPRPAFRPVASLGFDVDDPTVGRELGRGVAFKRVEVAHSDEPATSGRAYLYFWPGGMTERAAIQIGRKDGDDNDAALTVLVSPLTGQVKIVGGAKPMERPRDDSDREDTGF